MHVDDTWHLLPLARRLKRLKVAALHGVALRTRQVEVVAHDAHPRRHNELFWAHVFELVVCAGWSDNGLPDLVVVFHLCLFWAFSASVSAVDSSYYYF